MKRLIVCIVSIFVMTSVALAESFETGYTQWSQPNGSTFDAKSWGDEYMVWFETQNGYRFVTGTDGWHYYAILDPYGEFSPSQYRVGIDPPPASAYHLERTQARVDAIQSMADHIRSSLPIQAAKYKQLQASKNAQGVPLSVRINVLFAEFLDVSHYRDTIPPTIRPLGYLRSDFERMLFSSNNQWYDTIPGNLTHPEGDPVFGSLREFYQQMSLGRFVVNGNIVNPSDSNGVPLWISLPQPQSFYSNNSFRALLDTVFNRAVGSGWLTAADTASDSLKYVLVYAGTVIATCQWTCADPEIGYFRLAERKGPAISALNPSFMHMGLPAHEFGHLIGFEDEYIGISGGSGGTELYDYDLMADGEHAGPSRKGESPVSLSPFYRISMQWLDPFLVPSDTIGFRATYCYESPRLYRINPVGRNTTIDEHFLFETRLRRGFDRYLPTPLDSFATQHGVLLVWHHNSPVSYQGATIDKARLIHADNTRDKVSYRTDFFPRDSVVNRQSFNDVTTPATKHDSLVGGLFLYNERPAHFALNGIHRHKPSNPSDSDYTIIDSLFVQLTTATGSMTQNTSWSGRVHVVGDVVVEPGVVLTIDPGTTIRVAQGAKIQVLGAITAQGTSSSPVVFTSAKSNPAPGDWNMLDLKGGPNTLRHCDVKYSQGGVYFNNTSTNLLDSCTVKHSSGYAVQAFNTPLTQNSVKLRDCRIDSNEAGMWVSNGRVDITQTSSSYGFRNNPGYAVVLYPGGRVYLNNTYITNNEWGVYVNGTTAQATFSPDGVARGYNRVRDNSFGQIWVQTGSAFLGNTNTICRCDPPPGDEEAIQLDPKKPSGGGIETDCLPPCYVVPVEYGGYNYVSGNYYWVKKETYPGTYARLTYWGQPQVCPPPSAAFYGSVDRTECKTGGGENYIVGKGGGEYEPPSESLLDSTLIAAILESLKDDLVSGSVAARPALHQLASLCGVGGKFSHLLRMDWRNLLDHVLTRNVPVEVKHLVRAYRLQDMMDKRLFDEAMVYANVLSNIQDDELWFHAQSTIIYALAAKGQTEQATAHYQTIKGRSTGINPTATAHLEYFLGMHTSPQDSGGEALAMAVSPDAVTGHPSKTALVGNYPNPFNPSTTIRYTLAEPSFVSLRVYDLLGREVKRLVDEVQNPGSRSTVFEASGLASGIYFYKLQAGAFTAVKRMVVVK